jgi:hypothetical protein
VIRRLIGAALLGLGLLPATGCSDDKKAVIPQVTVPAPPGGPRPPGGGGGTPTNQPGANPAKGAS